MMLADKVIHNEEMKLCYQFVGKLGFPPHKPTELIKNITANIQNNNGRDESLQRLSFVLKS